MTDEEKLVRMIEFITERHLRIWGGYPYDYQDDGKVIYVAKLDDAKDRMRTKLVEYSKSELIAWYDLAVDYIATSDGDLSDKWDHYAGGNFGDWDEAFSETEPIEVDK